jgi:hypothetical protein
MESFTPLVCWYVHAAFLIKEDINMTWLLRPVSFAGLNSRQANGLPVPLLTLAGQLALPREAPGTGRHALGTRCTTRRVRCTEKKDR